MPSSNLKLKGYATLEELRSIGGYPLEDDFKRGPVAVIECIEEIPCNPCEKTCKKGAIYIGKPITNLPQIDITRCTGCGLCLANCPGLAIYIKDYTYTDQEALITFPYEFLPLPSVSQKVIAVNRRGEKICEGTILKVNQTKASDKTVIITMIYPKDYFHEVVSIKRW